jgi:predicted nucleic acid-binding protein
LSAYADTSFLVSLYVLDANSEAAAEQMKRAKLPLLLTPFGELELANAFALRMFRKELSASKLKAARSLLARDIENGVFEQKPLPEMVFARAKRLAQTRTPRPGTRTLDILHVASALLLGADTFHTMDRNQAKLARVEGLRVFWIEV